MDIFERVLREYVEAAVDEVSNSTRRSFQTDRGSFSTIGSISKQLTGTSFVDDEGNPIVFYHGTKREFDEFRNEFLDTSGTSVPTNFIGFYFTTSRATADVYASKRFEKRRGVTGHVREVLLNSKKPNYITEKTYWQWGHSTPEELIDMVTVLKSKGYDSIVMPSVWRGHGKRSYDVVVFDESQIISLK